MFRRARKFDCSIVRCAFDVSYDLLCNDILLKHKLNEVCRFSILISQFLPQIICTSSPASTWKRMILVIKSDSSYFSAVTFSLHPHLLYFAVRCIIHYSGEYDCHMANKDTLLHYKSHWVLVNVFASFGERWPSEVVPTPPNYSHTRSLRACPHHFLIIKNFRFG